MFDVPAIRGGAVKPVDAASLIIVRRDRGSPQVLMGRRHAGHDVMPGKWVFPGGRVDPSDRQTRSAAVLTPETLRRLSHGASPARARALAFAAVRETYEETGLQLADLSCLRMTARIITPPGRAKRFDTRFLLAPAEAFGDLKPHPHVGEFDAIEWVGIEEALDLDLPGVTRFMIGEVAEHLRDPDRPAIYARYVGFHTKVTPI